MCEKQLLLKFLFLIEKSVIRRLPSIPVNDHVKNVCPRNGFENDSTFVRFSYYLIKKLYSLTRLCSSDSNLRKLGLCHWVSTQNMPIFGLLLQSTNNIEYPFNQLIEILSDKNTKPH